MGDGMFLERGDHKIFYRLDGNEEGKRILLLNSMGTSGGSWDEVVENLKDDFHILRMDKGGHGQSSPWRGARRISDNTDDVLALMDHLGWRGADICGVSIGAMTAIDLAAREPDAVGKLVLSNTSAHVPPEGLAARIVTIREKGLAAVGDMVVGRFVSPGNARSDYGPFVRALDDFNKTDPESYIGWCEAIIAMDLRPFLPKLNAPAMVITGEWDAATLPEMGRFIASEIVGSKLVMLDAGHLPFLDRPAEYAQLVREFLN